MEYEKRRYNDALSEIKKNERKMKEIIINYEEETRNNSRLQELTDKLQTKLRIYKKQAEDAEEIASLNLAKFRKVSMELQEVQDRAEHAESQLAKSRVYGRNSNERSRCSSIRRSLNLDL